MTEMGMNYYIHMDRCECCGRPDRSWHLGKSGRTLHGDRYDTPYGKPITTFREWERAVLDPRGDVYDEHGTRIDKDVVINLFRVGSKRKLLADEAHYSHIVMDTEGHIILFGEFS